MLIAIINANIDPIDGPRLDNAILMVENGKIAHIGEDPSVIPSSARILDANRHLLTPGLIDVHTHLGLDEEGIGWEGDDYNELSQAVFPYARAIDGINPWDQGFLDAAQAGVTTVQVMPGSGNVIGGLMCCLKVRPGTPIDDVVMRNPSGLKVAFGENPKRLHGKSGGGPQTRMGIAALIRNEFVKAQNYRHRQENGDDTVDLGMEAMLMVLRGEIPIRAHAHRADDMLTALRIAREFHVDVSLEHCTEGHKLAAVLKKYEPLRCSIGPTLSSRSKVELRELDWAVYQAFEKYNLPFSITTDHPVVSIRYFMTTVGLAVRKGLSERRAWRAITVDAASHLGLEARVGSLAVGKDADLVIWSDNPLSSHGVPLLTMVDGTVTYADGAYKEGIVLSTP